MLKPLNCIKYRSLLIELELKFSPFFYSEILVQNKWYYNIDDDNRHLFQGWEQQVLIKDKTSDEDEQISVKKPIRVAS